jgi:hypothetical protein
MRPGQLQQLTVSAFRLDAEPPHVVAKAKSVKRRKEQVQALRPELAGDLARALANKMPDAPALVMPDKFSCASMFRADLRAARAAWIRAAKVPAERVKRWRSDFLAELDADGRRAIFYSLRHSHGVALADAGVSQKDVAASLHHTKTSTTDRYVMKGKLKTQARVVQVLPDVIPLRKTGTAGAADAIGQNPNAGPAAPARLTGACPTAATSVESSGVVSTTQQTTNPDSFAGIGVSSRARRDSNPQPPDRQSGTLTN